MSILAVENLSHGFADKRLYDDANFDLNKQDHMGIVGQNGAGKSTLIKILTGAILPDEGSIKWQNKVTYGYLDQYADIPAGDTLYQFLTTAYTHLFELKDRMDQDYADYAENLDDDLLEKAGRIQETLEAKNFYEIDTEIARVMSGLGLDDIGRDHIVSEMSGGQRSKIILAKLLLQNPDVLLLDEPTNYLDTAHIEWLENYLTTFDGTFIVISHDYDFLQEVTNCICDVAFGKIIKYRGNFKSAMRQKEARKEAQLKAFEKQQVVIEKAEKFIRKNKAGSHSTMAKSREKMLSHIDRVDPPSENLRAHFDFPYLETGSQNSVTVKKLAVGYGKRQLLEPVTFSLTAGEKIAFSGFNGAGKSTLIKSILGKIPALSGTTSFSPSAKVNYFSQELVWEKPELTPLQTIQNVYPDMQPRTIRTKLAKCGINAADTQKSMSILSGGEQTKVKICLLELVEANFLVMDEPTNHLDDETKSALSEALQRFKGNLIVVSHEDGFYTDWIDKELNVEKLRIDK
ncbi:ATP-binding cassette domain-containing protein [Pediococcus inopinatus]|uniref:ABC-F family ATP-binding cassette domain-containing protein n=1 Tax=Pediococcus inopinatus TaxID=114090 RepID=UPI002B259083|nr:ABC-F family ATP-binding cassette domain-containing protein [Pediococcus inopinatus]WPC17188.1 ATP-binding cassette domain-containing protein [Pediococcus inopinatus]